MEHPLAIILFIYLGMTFLNLEINKTFTDKLFHMDVPIAEVTKYVQLKSEVTYYERRLKSVGLRALKVIFVLALLVVIGNCLFNVIIEKESFKEWLERFGWKNLIFHFLFWTLICYLILAQKNYYYLKNKKRELHCLLLENPRLAKMTS